MRLGGKSFADHWRSNVRLGGERVASIYGSLFCFFFVIPNFDWEAFFEYCYKKKSYIHIYMIVRVVCFYEFSGMLNQVDRA